MMMGLGALGVEGLGFRVSAMSSQLWVAWFGVLGGLWDEETTLESSLWPSHHQHVS